MKTCFPDAVISTKKTTAWSALGAEKAALHSTYSAEIATYNRLAKILQLKLSGNDTQLVDEYGKQREKLEEELYQLSQMERAGRRRFLDNDPQAGVTSILGIRTKDDKVTLFFFVALVLFLSTITWIFLYQYGTEYGISTPKQKVMFMFAVLAFGIGISYFCIYRYA